MIWLVVKITLNCNIISFRWKIYSNLKIYINRFVIIIMHMTYIKLIRSFTQLTSKMLNNWTNVRKSLEAIENAAFIFNVFSIHYFFFVYWIYKKMFYLLDFWFVVECLNWIMLESQTVHVCRMSLDVFV